jgi:hypothetical protein
MKFAVLGDVSGHRPDQQTSVVRDRFLKSRDVKGTVRSDVRSMQYQTTSADTV